MICTKVKRQLNLFMNLRKLVVCDIHYDTLPFFSPEESRYTSNEWCVNPFNEYVNSLLADWRHIEHLNELLLLNQDILRSKWFVPLMHNRGITTYDYAKIKDERQGTPSDQSGHSKPNC